jgi:carotenoid cleavage dioxygenase-like enzyme
MATRTTADRASADRADAPDDYRLGFRTMDEELTLEALPVEGRFPDWLEGTLIRNGPARFEVGERSLRHWFDGQAMLHKFSFAGGRVSYANRFLRGRAVRAAEQTGRLSYREFATDPCRSLFGRAMSVFSRRLTDNCNVNLMRLGERAIAMTETPMPISFDPDTLEALGVAYDVPGDLTTAHPHHDPERREALNYATHFGPRTTYRLFGLGESASAPRTIARIGVREPAYMHSFAITERYAILVEFPLVVNPIRLALSGPAGRPFIENFRWQPERGSRFLLIDRHDGELAHTLEGPPLFSFHHVNAFERDDEVAVDLAAYDDASLVQSLYLDELRAGNPIPAPTLRRYRLTPASGAVEAETLSEAAIELPRIDYGRRNGRPYRFAYGAGLSPGSISGGAGTDFLDELVRIDVESGESVSWRQPGTHPGEPVFVGVPDRGEAERGVLLSVVLDPARARSFLLVLDATTLEELARAEVPHPIPFGFHGQYAPERA